MRLKRKITEDIKTIFPRYIVLWEKREKRKNKKVLFVDSGTNVKQKRNGMGKKRKRILLRNRLAD